MPRTGQSRLASDNSWVLPAFDVLDGGCGDRDSVEYAKALLDGSEKTNLDGIVHKQDRTNAIGAWARARSRRVKNRYAESEDDFVERLFGAGKLADLKHLREAIGAAENAVAEGLLPTASSSSNSTHTPTSGAGELGSRPRARDLRSARAANHPFPLLVHHDPRLVSAAEWLAVAHAHRRGTIKARSVHTRATRALQAVIRAWACLKGVAPSADPWGEALETWRRTATDDQFRAAVALQVAVELALAVRGLFAFDAELGILRAAKPLANLLDGFRLHEPSSGESDLEAWPSWSYARYYEVVLCAVAWTGRHGERAELVGDLREAEAQIHHGLVVVAEHYDGAGQPVEGGAERPTIEPHGEGAFRTALTLVLYELSEGAVDQARVRLDALATGDPKRARRPSIRFYRFLLGLEDTPELEDPWLSALVDVVRDDRRVVWTWSVLLERARQKCRMRVSDLPPSLLPLQR